MKVRSIVMVAALAALTILSAGCKKHSFRATGPIRFAISSAAPTTKSAYSGEIIGSKERIDWLEGDKIAIFMAWGEDSLDPPEDYVIRDYSVGGITTSGVKSVADVSPVGEALQWQDGDNKMYTFGALYPSPSVSSFVEGKWENKIDLYNLTLTYPAVQELTPKGDEGADALTLLPDMKYAYMFAFPSAPVESTVGTVNLSLSPMFTAFEISIEAGDNDEVNLTQFRLVSNREDEPLACVRNLYTDDSHGESTSITVDLTGIKLVRGGAPLVFTVFSYADSYQEITLEFTGNEIGTRKLDMKRDGEWIRFDAQLKHKITGLYFPKLDEGGASGQGINWNGTIGEDLNWNGAEGEDINWGGNKPYLLPGKFSISATQQVQFARGNLVYKAGEWDFHKQQYDRCLKDNATVLDFSKTGTFDLFGWATAGIAGADRTMVNYQPWSSDYAIITGQESTNAFGYGPSLDNLGVAESWGDAYAEYCEWGNNYNLQTKLGSGWFTLGSIQWDYIFSQRSASTVNGVENACFTCATVHSLPGLIIFPDDFGTVYTGDQTVFTAAQINERYNYSFSDTVLSDKVWKEVENAGAVFLAPTGTYAAEYGGYILENQGDYLNLYWSSSPLNMEQASVYGYDGGSLCVGFDGYVPRCFKCAVRLVRLAE